MFINAELTRLPVVDGRKAERRIVNIAAALRETGAVTTTVQVIDLSPGGFKAALPAPLEPQTEVWLKLPGFEAKRSRVVWFKNGEAGFEFEAPLHPAEIASLSAPPKRLPKNIFRRA
ncbi:PilZ domain-containing protein [Sphingosinicella rhizophila]|uniref:PilZ domain-containing protein n=1 Tax=Sphingosinicella rhizophila TaxID=3050082 RepID=A0ABU3Q714_9SPHN|nr:PilZ domain-containing protein [Sphingosinicella sp. GR2756]MDT9599112.1 PilZ domain-containing protein [Sphingosinicella sp. GR2756]